MRSATRFPNMEQTFDRALVDHHSNRIGDCNRSLDAFCREASAAQLLAEVKELEAHRRTSENLYERVRALFFLYAIYRFHLPAKSANCSSVHIPFIGYEKLLHRRYEEAISVFLGAAEAIGPSDGLCSALAAAYLALAFQTLADQVRRSVDRCAATNGCSASGIPPISRCASAPSCCERRRRRLRSRSCAKRRRSAWT